MAIQTRQITGPIATPENEVVLHGFLRIALLYPISDGDTLIAPFKLEYPITDGALPDTCKVATPGTYQFQILDTTEERVWTFQVEVYPNSGTAISVAELWQLSRLTDVTGCDRDPENFDVSLLGSNGAAEGEVLTADGAGGTEWVPIVGEGLGDMLKLVYDTNDDGKVDAADSADTALSAADSDALGGLTPEEYQRALEDALNEGNLLTWDVPTQEYTPNTNARVTDDGVLHVSSAFINGPLFVNTFVMTQVYYLIADESAVLIVTENAVELRLPDPAANVGRVIQVKKASSDGHTVTISSAGGGTIEGGSYYYLNHQYEAVTMIAINDEWFVF